MPSVLGNTTLDTRIALESDLEQQVVAVGKPFDAEVEYVTLQGDDVAVIFGEAYSSNISILSRVRLNGTPTKDSIGGIGYWGGDSSNSVQAKFDRTQAKFFPASNAVCSYADAINSWADFGIYGYKAVCGSNSTSVGYNGLIKTTGKKEMSIYWHESSFSFDVQFVETFESSVKSHSLVPVRVGTVGYLYDKVTGRLFGSATSTALVPGPDASTPTFTPKTEIDLLAPLASPAFTGTPTAPTAPSGTNTTQVATTAFVQGEVGVKADKVVSATSGDFAGLDENGNLTDSGKKAADFVEKPPYDAEVEYLESTGTQYIDTGIVPDNTTVLSVRGFFPCDKDGATRNGARVAANNTQFDNVVISRNQETLFRIDYGNAGDSDKFYPEPKLTAATYFLIDGPNHRAEIKLAGNIVSKTFSEYSFACPYNIFLFAVNYAGEILCSLSNVQISKCQIYKSGVLVRSFVPVRIGQVGYLYDRVSGQLFSNAGTGAFTLGPDKECVSIGSLRSVITNQWESSPPDIKITFASTQTGFTPTVRTLLVNRLAGIVHAEIGVSSSSTRTTNTVYTIATLSFTGFSCVKNQYYTSYGFNKRGLFTINTSYSLMVSTLVSWSAGNNDVFQVDFLTNSLSRQ